MKIGVATSRTARLCATIGGLVLAPVLLMAGGPLLRCYLRHVFRQNGPGLLDKEQGWVSPGYFVVNNVVVRCLTWPTEQLMLMLDSRRRTWNRPAGS